MIGDNQTGVAPSDLYTNTGIISTTEYGPFTKILTVRGITLMGRAEINDSFMNKVAATIEEMLPQSGSGIDSALQ